MSYSGNNISWPVSISDVQHVTGNNSSELKSLCGDSNNNVNKWARYKPERVTGHLPINYYRRKTNSFSLDVPYCIEWQDRDWHQNVMNGPVADVLYGNYIPWEYLKPRGVTNQGNEFYRLSDFSCLYDDDTDPYYSARTPNRRGYNHGAEIPFVTWLDMNAGFTTSQTTVDGISIPLYEFNIQHVSNITISFANESRGDELKLTDFIDINDSAQETDVAWRPVVQVFKQDPVGGVSWDNRPSPDWSFYGNVIKTNQNQKWSIQIPLSSFDVSDIGTGNKFYHMCVGIGCVNNNGTSWKGPDISGEPAKALFLPPYRDSQVALKEYPFHYYFWVVNHNVRGMAFTKLVWFNTGTVRDIVTDGYNSSFNLTSDATGVAWITFTVTKDTNQKIHFISEHGTADTGNNYEPFKVKFVSGNDEYFLSPVTENSPGCGYAGHASSVDNNAKVETGAATEIATLYGKLDISLHNLGSSTTYHVWTQTGSGGTWTNNGTLEIYKH